MDTFKRLFFLSSLLLFFCACKTAEQIKQEKVVTSLSQQMDQGQKVSIQNMSKMSVLEEQILNLQGQIEKLRYDSETSRKESHQKMQDDLAVILEKQNQIEAQLSEQKKFIDQVLKTLATLSDSGPKKTASKKKSPASVVKTNPYNDAVDLFNKNEFAKARPLLLKLESNAKLSPGQLATVIHALGVIEQKNKRYSNAIIYFSRVYSDYPKSGLVPSALYNMALSFKAQNQSTPAKQTLNELISKHSSSAFAKKGKVLLETL